MKYANTLKKSHFHFIGVGGIGMSALAELLCNMGAKVTGSDLRKNTQTERLQEVGVEVLSGHKKEHVQKCDVVVYSSAIPGNNPEMLAARENGIPQIPRAEALAEIMNLKRGIAVAGTHGKTTTTSMVASIFIHAERQPTIAVGGRLDLIKSTALLGEGEWMIAEADESDGSFSRLNFENCIITNIDNDHLDHYQSMTGLKSAFLNFALKTPFYGSIVACGDDENTYNLLKSSSKKTVFYGFEEHNDFQIKNIAGAYEFFDQNQKLSVGSFKLSYPGRHNALNAAAAILVSHQAGLTWQDCFSGIESFKGVDRRFQYRGEYKGICPVYDDYGHHPTEVKAILSAMKEKFGDKKIITVFQPHRFSRTEECWKEFTESFGDTDQLLILDIYPAGEKERVGVSSDRLAGEIQARAGANAVVSYCKDFAGVQKSLDKQDIGNAVVLSLGAGDIYKLYDYLT